MSVSSFLSNQGTQTPIIVDTIGGSVMAVQKIDISPLGSDGTIWGGGVTGTINNGSIVVTAGTVTVLPNIPGGTLALVSAIGTIGTIGLATVTGNVGVSSGTVNLGTFVGNGGSMIGYGPAAAAAAATGNPLNIGGTDSGGTIRTIKVDSGGLQRIGIDSGTISVLPNLPQGSITVTAGTVATLGTMGTLGLVNTVTTLSNLSAGSVNVIAGTIATLGTMGTLGLVNTITSVTGLASGTINLGTFVANGGTIAQLTNGSIVVTAGTVRMDARTTQNVPSYGTQVAFTGAAAATIIGSTSVGAGTSLWLQDVSLFNTQSAAGTFILGFGTAQQGTNVLLRAPIGTNSAPGIEKAFAKAVNAGMTNQDLVLSATGAGTVDLTLSYFISV